MGMTSKERATCRQACIVGLIKWKGRHVSSADWLRDSMWKVPGHQDLWAYLQKLIFWEKSWLHVDEVHGFILLFTPDFLAAFHVGFIPFFLLRWIKIGNTVFEGYGMRYGVSKCNRFSLSCQISIVQSEIIFVTKVSVFVSSLADQKQ